MRLSGNARVHFPIERDVERGGEGELSHSAQSTAALEYSSQHHVRARETSQPNADQIGFHIEGPANNLRFPTGKGMRVDGTASQPGYFCIPYERDQSLASDVYGKLTGSIRRLTDRSLIPLFTK